MCGTLMMTSMTFAQSNDSALNINYEISFSEVFQDALSQSNEYKALRQEILSSDDLVKVERRYFYPSLTLGSEFKMLYGKPDPTPDSLGELKLSLKAKIYGSGVSERIDAAEEFLDSGHLKLRQAELDIYYVVLKFLTKIERTRHYKIQADKLRIEFESYYHKQLNATKEGVSSQSNAMEVELNKVRFDEAVFGVVSNIDKYFKQLKEEIGYKISDGVDKNNIGINYRELLAILDRPIGDINVNDLIYLNKGMMSELKIVEASKLNAQSQRERLTVTLSNEYYNTLYGKDNDNDLRGNTDKSFVSIKIEYDIFNEQAALNKSSNMHVYLAEKDRYFKNTEQFKARIEALILKYETLLQQRNATIKQLSLNRDLIENQKREILIDKITYLDIAESMSAFNKAQIGLMNLELNLFDVIYQIMTMKSEPIF